MCIRDRQEVAQVAPTAAPEVVPVVPVPATTTEQQLIDLFNLSLIHI